MYFSPKHIFKSSRWSTLRSTTTKTVLFISSFIAITRCFSNGVGIPPTYRYLLIPRTSWPYKNHQWTLAMVLNTCEHLPIRFSTLGVWFWVNPYYQKETKNTAITPLSDNCFSSSVTSSGSETPKSSKIGEIERFIREISKLSVRGGYGGIRTPIWTTGTYTDPCVNH